MYQGRSCPLLTYVVHEPVTASFCGTVDYELPTFPFLLQVEQSCENVLFFCHKILLVLQMCFNKAASVNDSMFLFSLCAIRSGMPLQLCLKVSLCYRKEFPSASLPGSSPTLRVFQFLSGPVRISLVEIYR